MAKKIELVVDGSDNTTKLENVKICDRELIPEWVISTTKATETITDPNAVDENGNKINRVMGISSSIVKNSTVTLRPEEYFSYRGDGDAKESTRSTKKAG